MTREKTCRRRWPRCSLRRLPPHTQGLHLFDDFDLFVNHQTCDEMCALQITFSIVHHISSSVYTRTVTLCLFIRVIPRRSHLF